MIIKKKLALLIVVLALAGCASAPGGAHSGQAGTRSVINGVEMWKGGPPPRPYRVIATVERQGADESATYRQEESLIADDARQRARMR